MRAIYNPNLIAGKPATQAVRNPGAPENGKVLGWNNALKKWDAVVGGGGGGSSALQIYDASSGNYPNGAGVAQGTPFLVTIASPADVNLDVKFPKGMILVANVANPANVDADWTRNI